jgi:hypothetical protein
VRAQPQQADEPRDSPLQEAEQAWAQLPEARARQLARPALARRPPEAVPPGQRLQQELRALARPV